MAANGDKSVWVEFKDNAGNISGSAATGDHILLDTTPPTGTLVINGNATATNNAHVNLTLSATDAISGVSQMRFAKLWPELEHMGTFCDE